MIVLNVGGGGRNLPPVFDGWDQHLMDIDGAVKPDFCVDAREMLMLPVLQNAYDAVYCSHCLEHFYRHDVPRVIAGFYAALKSGGFAAIAVPDVMCMLKDMMARNLHIDDVWYRVGDKPITFHDVLYGWNEAMQLGNLFYAHKSALTQQYLMTQFGAAGFKLIEASGDGSNLFIKATK